MSLPGTSFLHSGYQLFQPPVCKSISRGPGRAGRAATKSRKACRKTQVGKALTSPEQGLGRVGDTKVTTKGAR
jgi:hypothetical protein